MATEIRKTVRHSMDLEKRGGYGSSSKQVSKLATPPRGPAPGASKANSKPAGQK
jgi:hypothetical protein